MYARLRSVRNSAMKHRVQGCLLTGLESFNPEFLQSMQMLQIADRFRTGRAVLFKQRLIIQRENAKV